MDFNGLRNGLLGFRVYGVCACRNAVRGFRV